MPTGDLVFKDGSSVQGGYRITQLTPDIKSLIFTTLDKKNIISTKEPNFIKSSDGILFAGLVKKNCTLTSYSQVMVCEFADKPTT